MKAILVTCMLVLFVLFLYSEVFGGSNGTKTHINNSTTKIQQDIQGIEP
jgi:hypothetical protein